LHASMILDDSTSINRLCWSRRKSNEVGQAMSAISMWVCRLWLVTAVTIQFLSTRPLFCFRVSMLHRSYYSAAACVSADQECVRSGLRTDLFVCTASYPASGDRIPALRLRVFLLWQISTKNMWAFGSEPKTRCRDRRIQLGSSLARLDPEPD
jgi:hypothetical protein